MVLELRGGDLPLQTTQSRACPGVARVMLAAVASTFLSWVWSLCVNVTVTTGQHRGESTGIYRSTSEMCAFYNLKICSFSVFCKNTSVAR